MNVSELINLIGLKSTDIKLLEWFEIHGLKKPPKTLIVNQNINSIKDKQNDLEYYFEFEIINEAFYPAKRPKNKKLGYECYLKSIVLFERKEKGNAKKPDGLWDGYINPESSFEQCRAYFRGGGKQSSPGSYFVKMLNDLIQIEVWINRKIEQIQTIAFSRKEHYEYFSMYNFMEDNPHNPIKQAYTLIVKWLFDNRYLLLADDIYTKA